VTSGAPDVLLWHAGKAYAMELKVPGGTVSDSQGVMLDQMSAAGVHCAICFGLDRALACLADWQLLRGWVQ
jgi:hypothetical protein